LVGWSGNGRAWLVAVTVN